MLRLGHTCRYTGIPVCAPLGHHYVRELAKNLLTVAAVEIYDEMCLLTRTCLRACA